MHQALPMAKTADESLTNLSSVFDQLSAKRSGQSTRLAILLSDGRHNDAAAAAPQEAARQCNKLPVYVVPIGTAVELRDVVLLRVEAPTAVCRKGFGGHRRHCFRSGLRRSIDAGGAAARGS